MNEEWELLASLLPQGWRELARKTGAMRRARGGVKTPETLLQLLLLHVSTGLSLKQAAVRAKVQGLATVTDVALLKRLRSSQVWLQELASEMFKGSRFGENSVAVPEGRRLRAIDATTVQEPGATGTDWRVHYSISLPSLSCDFYELTDVHGGETYTRMPIASGDIVLGDRGYAHQAGIFYVHDHGGDVVVRLNSTNVPLWIPGQKERFKLLDHLRRLKGHQAHEWKVQLRDGDRVLDARLCCVRKSDAAAALAKKRLRRCANRKGKKLKAATLECAEYVFVLTTLPPDLLNTREVLELYRSRWQIELCFKRLKSLFQLGHLPKRSDQSARAWMHGKLLTVLLIERLLDKARFFSPWGFDIIEAQ